MTVEQALKVIEDESIMLNDYLPQNAARIADSIVYLRAHIERDRVVTDEYAQGVLDAFFGDGHPVDWIRDRSDMKAALIAALGVRDA